MINDQNKNLNKLVGLRVIREYLGIDRASVASQLGVLPYQVYRMESQSSGTRQLVPLADFLACSIDDLFAVPSDKRLAEIRAAWLQREADLAKEALRQVS